MIMEIKVDKILAKSKRTVKYDYLYTIIFFTR